MNTVQPPQLEEWQERDLTDLVELFTSRDARSIEEMIAAEPRSNYVIESAKKTESGLWEVSFDNGLHTLLDVPDREVKKGDLLGLFCGGGSGFGARRYGFEINGEVIEYKTKWERYAERIKMLAEHDRRDREQAVQARSDVDQWMGQLKGPYRARIQRFIDKDPAFIMKGGTYETYPVLMAQRVEAWIREQHPDVEITDWEDAVALVKEFEALKYEEQSPVIHGGEEDRYGISGHQFESALAMAAAVLMGKEI